LVQLFKIQFMKQYIFSTIILLALTTGLHTVRAQTKELYSLEKSIALPGDGGFDYLFADQKNRRLYVTHATMVQVLNLDTEELVGTIGNLQGVHGVTVAPKAGKGFITDGKNNAVVVFDLKTLQVIKSIPVSGKKADAILYDAFSNQVLSFNNGTNNVSVIDVATLTEKAVVDLGGAPEFGVADGKGKIYNNNEDRNNMKIIDSKGSRLIDSIELAPCGAPVALGYDAKNKRLFAGCRENKGMSVIDPATKKIIETLPICPAVDAIVYDAVTKLIFCSGDGTTTIIKQETANKYTVVQTLATAYKAKTMAIDYKTHKIYLSVADYEPGTKKIKPGTFRVLVYKMN